MSERLKITFCLTAFRAHSCSSCLKVPLTLRSNETFVNRLFTNLFAFQRDEILQLKTQSMNSGKYVTLSNLDLFFLLRGHFESGSKISPV